MDTFTGNGFVLIGDAARFVDPIFSSGVSVALFSAKYSSERIMHAFQTADFSEASLKPDEKKLRSGTDRDLVRIHPSVLQALAGFHSFHSFQTPSN
jgi:flavin-dependent dehydrogenase